MLKERERERERELFIQEGNRAPVSKATPDDVALVVVECALY